MNKVKRKNCSNKKAVDKRVRKFMKQFDFFDGVNDKLVSRKDNP